MKHYLHISFYAILSPTGYSISDILLEVENKNLTDIRRAIKTSIENSINPDEGISVKNTPTIISINELSRELYDMLVDDGSREANGSENGD